MISTKPFSIINWNKHVIYNNKNVNLIHLFHLFHLFKDMITFLQLQNKPPKSCFFSPKQSPFFRSLYIRYSGCPAEADWAEWILHERHRVWRRCARRAHERRLRVRRVRMRNVERVARARSHSGDVRVECDSHCVSRGHCNAYRYIRILLRFVSREAVFSFS